MTHFLTFICCVVLFIVGLFIPAYISLNNDYVRKIEVDDSSKIEWAISNAVYDVSSRGFIVKDIDVSKCWIDNTFMIRCGGIERENLLRK